MALDFAEMANSLRSLGAASPTPAARDQVRLALASKFEGIQAVAAEALGAWGDDDSVRALHDWLDELLTRPDSMAPRSVAIRELAPHGAKLDADRVLDRYFEVGKSVRPSVQLIQHELLSLVTALPEDAIRQRVLAAGSDSDARMRRAGLLVIVRSRFSDREQLVRRFLADSDDVVRKIARLHAAA